MTRLWIAAALPLVAVASPTFAQESVEPATHPSWDAVAREGVQILRNSLYDPDSLTVEWVSGFKWGYRKPVIGKRTYGWIACGNFNAKNRMGGYGGEAGFSLFRGPDGKTAVYQLGDGVTTCSRGLTPVNPELIAATRKPPQETVSIADELAKLADLHSKGVLTDAEFADQKAKLLSR